MGHFAGSPSGDLCRNGLPACNENTTNSGIRDCATQQTPDVAARRGRRLRGFDAGRQNDCIKVMLSKNNPQTMKQLPASLDGYAVFPELTGEVRPLQK
jgi:hypothetical protein